MNLWIYLFILFPLFLTTTNLKHDPSQQNTPRRINVRRWRISRAAADEYVQLTV